MTVSVEQLYYTWDRRNIEGTGGLGILAHSTGWPTLSPDELLVLKRRLQLYDHHLPDTGLQLGSHALAWYRIADRHFLVRKCDVGADGVGRVGNFVAHALTGFPPETGQCAFRAAWAGPLPAHGLGEDVEPGRDLPPLPFDEGVGRFPHATAPLSDAALLGCVATVLAGTDAPVVVCGADPEQVAGAVWQVLAAFPPGFADDLTFSTHEVDPARSGVRVAGLVGAGPGFAPVADRAAQGAALFVDLGSGKTFGPQLDPRLVELADLLLQGRAAAAGVPGGALATLPTRLSPLFLLGLHPEKLDGAEALTLLESPLADDWWRGPMPPQTRQDLVVRALQHDRQPTLTALARRGAARADGSDEDRVLRARLLDELGRSGARLSLAAAQTLRLSDAEHAVLDVAQWAAAQRARQRSDLSARHIAGALVQAWPLVWSRHQVVDEVLRAEAVAAHVPTHSEFVGERASAMIDYALTPGPALGGFLTAVVRAGCPELVAVLLARLEDDRDAADLLADRLVGPPGVAPDAVPQLLDQVLDRPVRPLIPFVDALLDRHRADRAAVRGVLDGRRTEVNTLYALSPALMAHIWPEEPTTRRWWRRHSAPTQPGVPG